MESQKKETPQERYKKKICVRYVVELNKNTDSDLLELFSLEKNKGGLIKNLLREHYKIQKK